MSEQYYEVDLIKMEMLSACPRPSTISQIQRRTGRSLPTVRGYIRMLGRHVVKIKGVRPAQYMANPNKPFVPTPKAKRVARPKPVVIEPLPIPVSQTLSFASEYSRYTPVAGRHIEEKHGSWINRKEGSHMGNGSYAHMEMAA